MAEIGEIVNFIVRGDGAGAEALKETIAFGTQQANARGERFDIRSWLTDTYGMIRQRLEQKSAAGGLEGISRSDKDLDRAALSYLSNAVKFSATEEGRTLMAEQGVDGATSFLIEKGYADVPGLGVLEEAGVVETTAPAPAPSRAGETSWGNQFYGNLVPKNRRLEDTGLSLDLEESYLTENAGMGPTVRYGGSVADTMDGPKARAFRRKENAAYAAGGYRPPGQGAEWQPTPELARRRSGEEAEADALIASLEGEELDLDALAAAPDLIGDATSSTWWLPSGPSAFTGTGMETTDLTEIPGLAGDLRGAAGSSPKTAVGEEGVPEMLRRPTESGAGTSVLPAPGGAPVPGAAPAQPEGGGMSAMSLGGALIGGAGIASAIGNTIADFRTTAALEDQLAASAAGDTVARREGALAGSQAQRNIMATSLGRRDISPALALRNAQMAGSRTLSDVYGQAAIASARERRESEAQLAQLRKQRWNTLFGGLTRTAGDVGALLATQGAAEETANTNKRLTDLEASNLNQVGLAPGQRRR
ncbi:MAG: hypothetical protein GY772_02605 [bacterium]|nr:hypothetical protein [bacterium]